MDGDAPASSGAEFGQHRAIKQIQKSVGDILRPFHVCALDNDTILAVRRLGRGVLHLSSACNVFN